MSVKSHILVPRNFTTENLASGFSPESFPHVSAREAFELERDGAVERLGESGRIWRMKPNWAIRGFSARYGWFLALLRKDNALRRLMVSEITRRRIESDEEPSAAMMMQEAS